MYFVRYIVGCIQHLKYVIQSRPMIKSEFIAFTAEYSAESGDRPRPQDRRPRRHSARPWVARSPKYPLWRWVDRGGLEISSRRPWPRKTARRSQRRPRDGRPIFSITDALHETTVSSSSRPQMVSICGSNTKGRPLREHGRIGSNSVRLALRFPIAIRIQCVRSETVVRDGFVNMTAESPSTVAASNVDTTLDRRLWGIAIAFIAGGVMSILDTTIVNVAIKSLSVEFAADVATMQWSRPAICSPSRPSFPSPDGPPTVSASSDSI